MVADCDNGVFGTIAEAIEDLSVPRLKTTRPYCTFKGQLTLGDPQDYETAICIDVERYFRTKAAKPVSASSFVTRSGIDSGAGTAQSSNTLPEDVSTSDNGLSAVKHARTYKVKDESAPGGWKDVEREELEKGYEYGSTAVHIAASDENVTKLETVQSFSIIGFIPMDKVCEEFV